MARKGVVTDKSWDINWAQKASKGDYPTYLKLLKTMKITGKKRSSGFRVIGKKPFR